MALSESSERWVLGNAHLIWYNEAEDLDKEQALKEAILFNEPTFLYQVGDRTIEPPTGY